MLMEGRCNTCLVRDRALCAALRPDEREALSAICTVRRLAKGETLLWAGDEAPICANIQSGVLKLVSVSADGDSSIVGMVFPGDFIGHPFGGHEQHDVVALTDVMLCSYPRGRFEDVLGHHPHMEQMLLARTRTELDRCRQWLARMGRTNAAARVAGFVEDVARRMGALGCAGPAAVVDLPLSRSEMAELLGLTIETVSRQISRLKNDGIISLVGVRSLSILDPARLALMAAR